MSSSQYGITCPCCGNDDATCCSESRPFDFQYSFCYACGFSAKTIVTRMRFEDMVTAVNEERTGNDEPELSEEEIAEMRKVYDSADFSVVEDLLERPLEK